MHPGLKGLDLTEDEGTQVFQIIKFQGKDSDPIEDRYQLELAKDIVQPNCLNRSSK